MSDLIDRELLREHILHDWAEHFPQTEYRDRKGYRKRNSEIETVIINMPPVNPQKWIPVSKYGYPKPEEEYTRFLTVDTKGEITVQEFLLSLDEEPQPYFTGWRDITAYMPLPEPYKGVEE